VRGSLTAAAAYPFRYNRELSHLLPSVQSAANQQQIPAKVVAAKPPDLTDPRFGNPLARVRV
jgi:hypothetical protein